MQNLSFLDAITAVPAILPCSQGRGKARLRFSLTLLFLVAVSVSPLMAQSWFNSAWTSRQKITINSNAGAYALTASLTNFPFLVKIADGANDLFAKAQSTGNDILFTAEDGVTKIPHEIENYSNGGTKDLTTWVQLPVFHFDTVTVIYMYYGNPSAGSQQQKRDVWDATYGSVYHLKETGGSGNYEDSTRNANAGLGGTITTNQAPVRSTDSDSGYSEAFDGVDDYIKVPGRMGQPTSATVSGWVNLDAARNAAGSTVFSIGDSLVLSMDHATPTGHVVGFFYDGAAWNVTDTTVTVAGSGWTHVAYRIDDATHRSYVYINGVQQGMANYAGSPTYTLGTDTYIGKHGNGSTGVEFKGKIDELRFSPLSRSADWIMTDYQTQLAASQGAPASPGTVDNTKFIKMKSQQLRYFQYKQAVTINGGMVVGTQTNFPVLVHVFLPALHVMNPNGYDTLFTDASGVPLAHEIESYSGGELWAWVNVPLLVGGFDTTLYLYYGNASIVSAPPPAAVWDSSYGMVQHLNTDPSGTLKDSTSNGNNGASNGMAPGSLMNAILGKGVQFDGSHYITVPSSASLNAANGVTVSAWVNLSNANNNQKILGKMDAGGKRGFNLGVNTLALYPEIYDSAGVLTDFTSPSVLSNQWQYLAFTWTTGGTMVGYVNGVPINTAAATGNPIGTTGNPVVMGGASWSPTQFPVTGTMDEMRVSTIARSGNWIATEFNNQSDTTIGAGKFIKSLGPETTAYPSWWNAGWNFRKTLTLNADKVGANNVPKDNSDLANMPVLLSFTDAEIGAAAQWGGSDLAFLINGQKLDHELVSYDSTGKVIAWVKIPAISSSMDTNVDVYYGNPAAPDQQNTQGAWSNGFSGAWHLEEAGGGVTSVYRDSSPAGNNGTSGTFTVTGTPTPVPAGKIAGAQSFDGVGNSISTSWPVTDPENFTVSAWVNTNSALGHKILGFESAQTGQGSGSFDRSLWIGTDGKAYFGCWSGGAQMATSALSYNDSAWHYLVGVRNNSTGMLYLYADGAQVGTRASGGAQANTEYWRIGSYQGGGGWTNSAAGYFPGLIDEVRISYAPRSADWVKAEFVNQNTPGSNIIFDPPPTLWTWNGVSGTSWSADGSWVPGSHPNDISKQVLIGGTGGPQLVENIAIKRLTIQPAHSVDLNGYTLSIDDANGLENQGTIYFSGRAGASTDALTRMDTTSGTVVYRTTAATIRDFGANDYFNLTVDGITGDLASDITVAGNLAMANNATLNLNGHTLTVLGDLTGTGTVVVGSGTLVAQGNLTVSSLSAASGLVQVARTFNPGSFAPGASSTVEFVNPAWNGEILGNMTFNTLKVVTPGKTVLFANGTNQTVANFVVTGAIGNQVSLLSTTDASPWTITPTAKSVSYAYVKDSTAVGSVIYANNSVNGGGNNAVWQFNTLGQLHHFAILPVTTPQTAGVPFPITITAQDASSTTVAGFTGTVTITDRTGTITPAVSGNFVAGVRTEMVMISAVATNVTIVVSNGTIQGQSAAFDVQAYTPYTGLIGYWKFDEGAGTTAVDSSVSSNAGTLVNGTTWTTGVLGGAVNLNGTTNYVSVANQATYSITGSMTVAAWIKVAAFNKTWQSIVTKGDNAWRLMRNSTGTGNANGICFSLNSPSATPHDLPGNTAVNDGRWHYVSGVYDGAKMYLYIDGNLDNSASVTGAIATNTYNVFIGENAQITGRQFSGLIDDVRIYNRALGPAEISALYYAPPPRLTPVTIASNNAATNRAKVGDQVTVAFTATQPLLGLPTATIAGHPAVVVNTSGLAYTAKYTMASGDTEGAVAFTVDSVNAGGCAGAQVTATTDASSVTFDRTAPTLPTVTIASNNANATLAKTGNVITVAFTASETLLLAQTTATIRGQAAAVTNVGGLNYTATYTMAGTDTEGLVPFTVSFADAAGNAGTPVSATTNASSVTFDRTAPALPTVTIASNNANTALAKTGNVITVAFTASETLLLAQTTATIRGQAAAVANVGGLNYTATYTMLGTDTEGVIPFAINSSDAAGNAGTAVSATTNASSVTFDRTAPTLTTVTVASNNANIAFARTGDTVTVAFTASETLIGLPTATIRGQAAGVANVGGLNFTAVYTMLSTDTEGVIPFAVNFTDTAGNAGTQVTATTNASSVTFDRTAPTLPTVTVASNNANTALAKTGNVITVAFTASETLLLAQTTATIRGQAAAVANVGGLNYTATYTMLGTDAEGLVPFTVNFTDAAGNAGTAVSATTNASSVSFDRTPPTLTTVTIASNNANAALAKTGNVITVAFTASETLIGLPTATIRGQAAAVANVGGLNYTATYTMLGSDAEGVIPFSISFSDAAGNAGTAVSATTNASTVSFDRTPPTLTTVTIASNNSNTALAKTGNVITVAFTASETLIGLPTATIRGQAAGVANVGGPNYTATYTMLGTDTEGLVPFTVNFTDAAGNAGTAVSATTNASSVSFDRTPPTLTTVTIASNNANTALAKTGNVITVAFTASETLIGLPTATIRGQAAGVANVGGLNYTATYTTLGSDTEGLVPFTVNFTDAAGNAGTAVSATTNASSVSFDRTPPTLTTVTIASNNANTALAKTGNLITVAFTASETLIGLPTATIRGQAAGVANVGGLNYTATYTMLGSDTEGLVPFTVNFADAAGNAGTQVSATTNASSVSFDRTPPTLTTVTIASNNANTALAKTGNMITVDFTASETLIGLPTATIRGQAAGVANVGGLNYTATYTMLGTDAEGVIPFAINFSDAAGNAGTAVSATTNASSVSFDRTPPTLTTVTIASNNANTALAKTGNMITVDFTASETLIGLPTATIRGQAAVVANVGGLNYTATYTMAGTDTEGLVPFAVNFTDTAGNAGAQVTATTNASSVTFDRTAPTLTTVTMASNNANTALAKTGNVITVAFTASETLLLAQTTAAIRGQAAVVANVGGLNYTATYTMLGSDAEGVIPFSISFSDAAGNAGTAVSATTNASSVSFDRTPPTLTTVTIASNNADTALAKTGNVITVDFTASETMIALPTATIRGQAAVVANVGGLNYTATYTMQGSDTEGVIPFAISFSDAAGNAGTAVSASTNASSVSFDRTPPTLTTVTVASNDANTALAKTGNVITVAFTASETLIGLPAATIRGQAAVVANVGGLNYTAAYTMLGTDAEGVIPFAIDFTDAAGNAGTQVTATTNASSVTFDRTAPTILSHTLPAGNAYVDVQMSEGVYTTAAGGPLVVPGDLVLLFSQNGGHATGCTIASLSRNDNSALSGGESIIRVHLSVAGVPNGLETIQVQPANGNAIFDAAGNPMAGAETTGAIALTPSALIILARETVDADGDGFIDQIRITTQQTLNDNFGGLSVGVAGHTVLSYDTGSTAGDNIFVVRISKGLSFDTGSTPVIQVMNGGSLKSADGLYTLEAETTGVAATDKAAPVLGITLAAVGGSRIYLEFSEPVYSDSLATTSITVSDFTYAGTTLTPIDLAGQGMSKAFFNLAAPLTGDNVVNDLISAVNGSAVFDSAGNAMSVTVRPVSMLGLGVVEPVWATDGLSAGAPPLAPSLKKFDGTGKLMDGDIRLQTNTLAPSLAANAVDLFVDSNVPSSLKANGFWLPSPATLPRLVSQADPNAEAIAQSSASAALRDFLIPSTDANIDAGHTVDLVPGVQMPGPKVLYCLRVTDVNDPRTVRPYSFRVEDIQRQRGGTTILSNVIHPAAGEKTTLVYTLPSPGHVTIQVFTMDGCIVNVLCAGTEGAGDHRVTWDGRNRAGQVVARGLYFIRAVGPKIDEIRKVLVVR